MNKIYKLIEDIKSYKYMPEKPFYYSKTFWINAIAVAALIAQAKYGFIISPEEQAGVIVVINLLLRVITKKELTK